MKKAWLFAGLLLLCAGCASLPFEPVSLVSMEGKDSAALLAEVRSSLPTQFKSVTSVVFEYRGRAMSALGCNAIDTSAGTFSVVAMTPLGMKLFELSGNGDCTESLFVAPQIAESANPVNAIAEDIRNVYLDLLPPQGSACEVRKDTIVLRCDAGDGHIEYSLGGDPAVLLEKRCYDGDALVWRISYHDYVTHGGKRYPGGIVLKHKKHGYRLIIRLKEILEPQTDANGTGTI